MKKLVSFVLLVTTLLQSCLAYQKTLVSMHNVYYGVDTERQKRLDGINEIVNASAQLIEEELGYIYLTDAKNTIYGSAGIGIWNTYSIGFSYERKISGRDGLIDFLLKMGDVPISPFIRVSIGKGYYFSEASYFTTEIGALSGKKKSHFEYAIGAGVFVDGYDKSISLTLSGFFGYRYQKPSGGLIFRTGLGVPELIYAGVGVSF